MFNSKHYVPILKWKRAEQSALRELEKKHKTEMTPLIQFVMPKPTLKDTLESLVAKYEAKMPEIPGKIIDVWGREPIFIDVSLLFTTQLKVKSLGNISRWGHKQGGRFIPTIHLNDEQSLKNIAFSIARESKSGLCLRLICPDLDQMGELKETIMELLNGGDLTEKDIDLLVDIKEIKDSPGKYEKYLDLSQEIPGLLKWRTFTFASGSFPEDMSNCGFEDVNLIPRIGWKIWKERVQGNTLKRKPAFADYTIQYPIYKESIQFYHPSTSIKYALENEWLVLTGKRKQYDHYLANAKVLSNRKEYYYGKDFSFGDKYIAEKALHFEVYMRNKKIGGTGSTETWLKAGINHHLALVTHQIANLT